MQAHWTSSRGRALARSSAHRRAWQVPPSRRCAATQQTALSYTERVFRSVDDEEKGAGGAGAGTSSWAALQRADAAWNQLKTGQAFSGARPAFVRVEPGQAPAGGGAPYDVVVCGGTLGVFIAAALAQRNLRVAVVERGPLQGRAQEWNISRKELGELVQLGLLTADEVEASIRSEFNPVRVGFHGTPDVWTRDVLNVGVSPDALIQTARAKLEGAGGAVLERTALQGITVHADCALLQVAPAGGPPGGAAPSPPTAPPPLRAQLVLDCLGHASPIVKQIRWGQRPDGICAVVGSMGSGFKHNTTGDVIYTFDDLTPETSRVGRLQRFWEAFPSGTGPTDRTTYMFAYLACEPSAPSLLDMFEDMWPAMARYQDVRLEDITVKRTLFGVFPTYRDSPLKPAFDRVLQVGDASGVQSPLSFGGFGALTRHLGRLTGAVHEALQAGAVDAASLSLIHGYNPGLSSSWMLQQAMSVRAADAPPPSTLINKMLGANFAAMERLGDPVMKPFMQDVIQLGPLLSTMGQQVLLEPTMVPRLMARVGPGPLLDWLRHVLALAAFTGAHKVLHGPLAQLAESPQLTPKQRFALRRTAEAVEFGAGLDYKL